MFLLKLKHLLLAKITPGILIFLQVLLEEPSNLYIGDLRKAVQVPQFESYYP